MESKTIVIHLVDGRGPVTIDVASTEVRKVVDSIAAADGLFGISTRGGEPTVWVNTRHIVSIQAR